MSPNMNKRKKKLVGKLKTKEYRDAFVSEHIDIGIPFQIRSIRKKKGWTQTKLGNLADMRQERISEIERLDTATLTLSTLKKLASAFDVALMVRFAPFSDLVKWELNLSPDTLKVNSFKEDSFDANKEFDIRSAKSIASSNPERKNEVQDHDSSKAKSNVIIGDFGTENTIIKEVPSVALQAMSA